MSTDKREMARLLRAEAEEIRRTGFSNFFGHTFACLRYGQANLERDEDRCGDCPLRPFVPPAYRDETFPCQHIDEEGWALATHQRELAERYAAWMLRVAQQLEAEAGRETH